MIQPARRALGLFAVAILSHALLWDTPVQAGTAQWPIALPVRSPLVRYPRLNLIETPASKSISEGVEPLKFLAPFRSYPTGLYPQSVAVADVNEDAHPDLLVACPNSRVISIYTGQGDGTLEARRDIPTTGRPSSVIAADLNHDGHSDIIAAEPGEGLVSVFLGRGDGTMGPESAVPVAVHDQQVAVGDFNGDGQLDLTTANDVGGTISILPGNGDGTFGSRVDLPTGGQPSCVVVADVNGDGFLDLLVAEMGLSGTSVWLGQGNGTFQPVSDPRSHIRGKFIAAGDFDRDGKLDVAAVLDTISLYSGNGDGTFGAKLNLDTDQPFNYTSIAAGDVNHDGVLDLVAARPLDPNVDRMLLPPFMTIPLLIGNGDGTFKPRRDIYVEGEPWFAAISDLNGDLNPDIITANAIASSVSILPGNGDGTFGTDKIYSTGGPPWYMESGDFNRDGHLDLVTANKVANTVSVFLGNGDGTLRQKIDYPILDPMFVVPGDFNGDGQLDLVVAGAHDYFTGSVDIWLGRGDGSFNPQRWSISDSKATWIAVADLNGNDKQDIVLTTFYKISVLLGKGDGSFSPETPVADQEDAYSVGLGDVNGDGRSDLAFPENDAGKASVLPGIGDGTFGPRIEIAVPGRPMSVRMGDLNNDGKVDLVVGGTILSVALGNGDGTFQPASRLPTGWFPADAVPGDVDGDGHEDIVSANFNSNTLSVLRGHGDGTFELPATFGARGVPESVVIGDLDEDGQADIALASLRTGISILLNRTGPPTPLPARAFLRDGHRSIALAQSQSQVCILVEPVGGSYDNTKVDLSTIHLVSPGTGIVGEIAPIQAKTVVFGDVDRNGVPDLPACFSRTDLARLFSSIRGRQTVGAAIEGHLSTGRKFRAPIALTIVGMPAAGHPVVAFVSPNPLNPRGTLKFTTSKAGDVTARLFGVSGRLVRTLVRSERLGPGEHSLVIDGRDDRDASLATGVYFYKIETPDGSTQGRFVVAK